MSSKHKGARAGSSLTPYQLGLRNLERQDYKQALKDARVCFRQESTPEHRQLLEQAALARARELQQVGLTPQAIDILNELLALPVQDLAVRNATPELLHKLGIIERYPQFRASLDATPELKARLELQVVDDAVLKPTQTANVPRDVRETGALVRQAWELVTDGREAEGLELLKDIPRQSSFADWRLFLRGLAAYYRNDTDTQNANWSRLDHQRLPARLTQVLVAWRTPEKQADLDPRTSHALERLERDLWGISLDHELCNLRDRVAEENWEAAIAILGRLRSQLRRHSPGTLLQLTRLIREQVIQSGSTALLTNFKRCADALDFDPQWHLTEAQVWEQKENQRRGPESEQLFRAVNSIWKSYIQDLDLVPVFSDSDKTLGRALIWSHLASRIQSWLIMRGNLTSDPRELTLREFKECDELVGQARECFSKSLTERPDLIETHRARCLFLEAVHSPDEAMAARHDLLAAHPGDEESLEKLVDVLTAGEHYSEALPLFEQLLRIKPLDEYYRSQTRAVLSELAREAALKKKWDVGREYFERIYQELEGGVKPMMRVRRAIFETAAGHHEQAAADLDVALNDNGATVEVAMWRVIEAIRYRLPKAAIAALQSKWEELLAGKFNSNVAAQLCTGISFYFLNQIRYTGRPGHVKLITAYLKQGVKAKFEQVELEQICTVLKNLEGQSRLANTYVKLGQKLFKKAPLFDVLMAQLELGKRPERCPYYLVESLALAALSKADPTRDQSLIDQANQLLDTARQLDAARMSEMMGGFFAGTKNPFERFFK